MPNDIVLLPWAVLLSALALFFAWRAARAGDRAAVIRRLGWALVPWALWMIGVLRLVVRIADAVADWAAGFVFRPSVWLGLLVAAIAIAMIVVGTRMKARSGAGGTKRSAPAGIDAAPGASRKAAKAKPKAAADDDMSEIEDILRRHGIQ